MPATDLWHVVGSILPHVRDPWPQSIGLGFPFTVSGALSILAEVLAAEVPRPRRDRIVSKFSVYGFGFGVVLYLVSLLLQLTSAL